MVNRRMLAPLLAALALCGAAQAQAYPVKPVTLIVPWPAGGSTDIAMRAIADAAEKHLGQPIVVDNKAGGSGTVGPATMAAAAKPDGYTIAQMPITVFRLPLMQKTTWDPLKDFTYVVHLTGYTFGVTTSAELAIQDLGQRRRVREAESRQGHLRDAGRRHLAAHRHGADRGESRHQADACAVQGRRRDQRRGARRPHDAAGGFERLEAARRGRQAAPPDDLDRQPLEELARDADAARARLSVRARFAVRDRRTEGHGPEDRREAPRRLQESDRRPGRAGAAREVRHGRELQEHRGLPAPSSPRRSRPRGRRSPISGSRRRTRPSREAARDGARQRRALGRPVLARARRLRDTSPAATSAPARSRRRAAASCHSGPGS